MYKLGKLYGFKYMLVLVCLYFVLLLDACDRILEDKDLNVSFYT